MNVLRQEQIDDINDICLELRDIGYICNFRTDGHGVPGLKLDPPQMFLYKGNTDSNFFYDYTEIEDTYERIKDYMGPYGFDIEFRNFGIDSPNAWCEFWFTSKQFFS